LSFEREHRIAQVMNEWMRETARFEKWERGLVSFYMVFFIFNLIKRENEIEARGINGCNSI
jgi:hypothetical protein